MLLTRPLEILLVEDNPADVLLLREGLDDLGQPVRIHVAEDGSECLQFVRKEGRFSEAPRPDLILLDLNLPRTSGLATLDELKNDPRSRHIPVVVLTSSEAPKDILSVYASHANAYVSKPVEFDGFQQACKNLYCFWGRTATLPTQMVQGLGLHRPAVAAGKIIPPRLGGVLGKAPTAELTGAVRILVVEDCLLDAQLIDGLLTQNSGKITYITEHCATLEQARARAFAREFDLALLDLQLPDPSHLQGLTSFVESCPGLPTIVLTGGASDELKIRCLDAGAEDFLAKQGLSAESLEQAITYVMCRSNRTRRRQLQAERSQALELERLNQALRNEVEERKRAEAELNEANAALQRTNDDLRRFTSAVSHDLRSPLRAIGHLVGFIEEDFAEQLPEKVRAHVQRISERGQHCRMLIEELLAWARAGRGGTEPADIELEPIVRDIIANLEGAMGFRFEIEGSIGQLRVQVAPFRQSLRNLLANAITHHDTGKGTVRIQHRRVHGVPEISISDDGPGIDPKVVGNVFDLFVSSRAGGHGLGLAIVRKLVEGAGGTIGVESSVGTGTTFTISWPESRTA